MPVTCGHVDSKGTYCIWGEQGAHYYYTPGDKESMERARSKATSQGRAAHAHGYRGAMKDMEVDIISDSLDKINKSLESLKKSLP